VSRRRSSARRPRRKRTGGANTERRVLGHRALYERGLRVLDEPAGGSAAATTTAPLPATTDRPLDPTSEEARLAREAAMDRRLAKLWSEWREE